MISVKGKWAFITGASRGIGKNGRLLNASNFADISLADAVEKAATL